MGIIYAVGFMYISEWEGEVIQHYSFWSTYEEAQRTAMNLYCKHASAIVVQRFDVDSTDYYEPEIIKSHEAFVRFTC